MIKFTKIYIEITNICNLNCSFCSQDKRQKEEMSLANFEKVLKQIKPYTKTIYLHVKGEPLLYSKLDELLTLTEKYQLNVRITTNGTCLLKNVPILEKHSNIKQINVSLHSEQKQKNYFEDVFQASQLLSPKIPIIFRIWTLEDYKLDTLSTIIVDKIINYFHKENNFHHLVEKENNLKIQYNIYLDKDNQFTWPTDTNKNESSNGTCFATRTHIAILVNGDVVPCCLDSNAHLKLGNLFETNLETILESEMFQKLRQNFQKQKLLANLCRNCDFRKQKLQ